MYFFQLSEVINTATIRANTHFCFVIQEKDLKLIEVFFAIEVMVLKINSLGWKVFFILETGYLIFTTFVNSFDFFIISYFIPIFNKNVKNYLIFVILPHQQTFHIRLKMPLFHQVKREL